MFESMPSWVEPAVAVFVGFLIQGPGFWLLKWLEGCIQANKWTKLPLEPKYLGTWIFSLLLLVTGIVTVRGKLQVILDADWYGAIAIGLGTPATVSKARAVIAAAISKLIKR